MTSTDTTVIESIEVASPDLRRPLMRRPWFVLAVTFGILLVAGALWFENSGDVDETLVGASTDACRVIEIHRSAMTDGVMTMQQLPTGLRVRTSESVTLEPGGLHLMCIDKLADFSAGSQFELTLEFVDANGGSHSEVITATVEDR